MTKVLRIKLTQNQALYKKEETVENKMTYPLPPFSTVIGALHNACGYDEYKSMELCILGKYGYMKKEIYTNHTILNRLEDDRGILVWFPNSDYSNTGYISVANSLKQNSSFRKNKDIEIFDEGLFDLYGNLYEIKSSLEIKKKEEIKPVEDKWKKEKKELKARKKLLKKGSSEIEKIDAEIKLGDEKVKKIKEDFRREEERNYTKPIGHFKTLVKGPKYQEVLHEVELIIYIRANDEVVADIMNNKFNFTALGRSEDFIDLLSIDEVKLCDIKDCEHTEILGLKNGYSMYVNAERVDNGTYLIGTGNNGGKGTVYNLAKNYIIEEEKREFNKIACYYTASIELGFDSTLDNIYYDKDSETIVDFN